MALNEYDERGETFEREQAVRESQMPPLEYTGDEPVTETPAVEQTPEVGESQPQIMIPKPRFDEVNNALKEARTKLAEVKTPDLTNVESIIEQKLAPFKVQLETEQVLRQHSDFPEFADTAVNLIKENPSLSLENAYRLAKFEHLESKAKEEGKTEAYQTIEKKADLQFEQTTRKTVQRPVEDLVRDKTVPLSEIAKMLPRE